MSEHIILPSSRVAVGHCVIISDSDCPEGRLVAIVTAVSDDTVTGRYLHVGIDMTVCWQHVDRVTPVSAFGVRVIFDGDDYWCEPDDSLPKTASYPDGEPRPWQERRGPVHHKLKKKPLRLALETKGDSCDKTYR